MIAETIDCRNAEMGMGWAWRETKHMDYCTVDVVQDRGWSVDGWMAGCYSRCSAVALQSQAVGVTGS